MPRQARVDAPGTLIMVKGIGRGTIVHDKKDRQDFASRKGYCGYE
jgi:hypothetical protein